MTAIEPASIEVAPEVLRAAAELVLDAGQRIDQAAAEAYRRGWHDGRHDGYATAYADGFNAGHEVGAGRILLATAAGWPPDLRPLRPDVPALRPHDDRPCAARCGRCSRCIRAAFVQRHPDYNGGPVRWSA